MPQRQPRVHCTGGPFDAKITIARLRLGPPIVTVDSCIVLDPRSQVCTYHPDRCGVGGEELRSSCRVAAVYYNALRTPHQSALRDLGTVEYLAALQAGGDVEEVRIGRVIAPGQNPFCLALQELSKSSDIARD